MSFKRYFQGNNIGFMQQKPSLKEGCVICKGCKSQVSLDSLSKNLKCCTRCGYYFVMNAEERIQTLVDEGSFRELFSEIQSVDVLDFVDEMPYTERLKLAKKNSSSDEAVKCGTCTIKGMPVALAVMDFTFMGGSMGSCVGERISRLIELAIKERLALIIVSASGGARMQESTYSLMQMAKISSLLSRLDDEKLAYISVLTHPTTGGVIASFAALGDIILAEKGALIGFTGPRVIEKCIGQKLPKGAQKSEYLLEKGMVDQVVSRIEIREKCARFIDFFTTSSKKYVGGHVCKMKLR